MKKIAVPVTSNNKIDDHFGHCEFYRIFTISETNEIVGEKILKLLKVAVANLTLQMF